MAPPRPVRLWRRRSGPGVPFRTRRAHPDSLIQGGAPHEWRKGRPALDLIVTLDDATSTMYSAFLVDEEGTGSSFRALREVFGEHGLPMSLTRTGALSIFTRPKLVARSTARN
ncbi:MAG: hypothetical protein ACREDA_07955 [Methylocella sp.]